MTVSESELHMTLSRYEVTTPSSNRQSRHCRDSEVRRRTNRVTVSVLSDLCHADRRATLLPVSVGTSPDLSHSGAGPRRKPASGVVHFQAGDTVSLASDEREPFDGLLDVLYALGFGGWRRWARANSTGSESRGRCSENCGLVSPGWNRIRVYVSHAEAPACPA